MNAPAPEIRRLTPDDAAAMLMYLRALTDEGHDTIFRRASFPTEEQEREWLCSRWGEDGAVFAAQEQSSGRIVGICEATRPRPEQARHNAELGVSVLRAFQRQGLATALIGRLVGWCGEVGVRQLRLEVMAHHHGGIALYRRLGFVDEGRKRGFVRLDDGYVDLVLMARAIADSG